MKRNKIGALRIWAQGEIGLFAVKGTRVSPRDWARAFSFWKAQGCIKAFGPVVSGIADTGGGLCVWRSGEKEELLGSKKPINDDFLTSAGFVSVKTESAFRVPVPHIPQRRGMQVRGGVRARACADILRVNEKNARRALFALPHVSRRYSCIAFDGGSAGFLLCLARGKRVRLLTLWTREDRRNGAACVPMLAHLAAEAKKRGIREIDASRVPWDNPLSLRLVKALGGREISRYRYYERKLDEEECGI